MKSKPPMIRWYVVWFYSKKHKTWGHENPTKDRDEANEQMAQARAIKQWNTGHIEAHIGKVVGEAETAPLAICRALLAVESERKR